MSLDGITTTVGLTLGYRDDVWTNWYRRNTMLGVLTLAYMRNQLNKHNLLSTYPRDRLIGWLKPGLTPPPGVTHFRTADGSWNNLSDPKEGAAGTRFPRNVRNYSIRAETGEQLMTPNPRLVSLKLLRRGEQIKEVPFLNMLAACWINFENHDWISHAENLRLELHEIPLAEDDPARIKFRQKYLYVGKTQPDPTRDEPNEITPTTFINEVTHWWDGSQIYGSDQATVDALRSHVDGKIRLTEQNTLPLDHSGVEQTGFKRDWWVGLAMLHTLFAREHNAICDMLKAHNPDWDDNRLFNVARLINAAVMAKIHSVEWTPAILPNQALSDGLNANWYGLLTNLLRHGKAKKTVAPINVRNPELGGVVGNPINKHGVPYGLTEEFVEVYRLHSLLPEKLHIQHLDGSEASEIDFPASRQAGSPKVTAEVGMTDLFYSFGNQHPGQLVLHNFPNFMVELSIPGNPVFDLAAVDVLRARERGVPRYNEFRRQLGLNPLRTLEDLTTRPGGPEAAARGLRRRPGRRRADRPDGRDAGRDAAADGLRLRRDAVPDLHPQRDATAAGGPLLHGQLQRGDLHERGSRVDRRDGLQGRDPASPPGAGAERPREHQERVRAVGYGRGSGPGAPPAASLRPRPSWRPVDRRPLAWRRTARVAI